LDWDNNVVVFGSESNETQPIIAPTYNGQYRAFCIWQDNVLRTRRSLVSGEAWEASDDQNLVGSSNSFAVTRDNEFTYIANRSRLTIFTIAHSQLLWPDDNTIFLFDTSSYQAFDCDIVSDFNFDADDPFLHGCCLYLPHSGSLTLAYFRSEDRAQTFALIQSVDSMFSIQDSSASVVTAVTWSGEEERIWLALTTDRAGTTGEQIRLYASSDLGQSWATPVTPDSSTYAMMRPALLGHGETIMLAYQRRSSASIARDIFVVYSPDNGVSWSEPLQLTNSSFDDVEPTLTLSGDQIGLFYGRAQAQEASGQLYFRQSSLTQPWIWTDEVNVSSPSEFILPEGYSATGNDDGFAAVWSSRIVGDDGDILFDGSWRGTAVRQPSPNSRPTVSLQANTLAGWIEISNPTGVRGMLVMYDILGRNVARASLASGENTWRLPVALPSGTYWLTHPEASAIRIQVLK